MTHFLLLPNLSFPIPLPPAAALDVVRWIGLSACWTQLDNPLHLTHAPKIDGSNSQSPQPPTPCSARHQIQIHPLTHFAHHCFVS